jgi:hypothetical protein
MKRFLAFALASAALIGLVAFLAVLAFPGQGRQDAIITSAGIAFMVQVFGFGLVAFLAPANVMLGWGAGMLVRLITLMVHGFIGARIIGQEAGAALLSLAAFFFLTSIIEPLFLPQPPAPARVTR